MSKERRRGSHERLRLKVDVDCAAWLDAPDSLAVEGWLQADYHLDRGIYDDDELYRATVFFALNRRLAHPLR